jgi:hypothetical protein
MSDAPNSTDDDVLVSGDLPDDPFRTAVELQALFAPRKTATKANIRRNMTMATEPQVTLFDGKSLPAGADEDWWGGPVSTDDPEAGRTLNVPARANQQKSGAFSTTTAKPGDTVTVWAAEGTEGDKDYRPAWGKVGGDGTALPPDDPALAGPDKQTEFMKDAHKKAHGLAADADIGTTVHGPAGSGPAPGPAPNPGPLGPPPTTNPNG